VYGVWCMIFTGYGDPTGTCGSYAAGPCDAASTQTVCMVGGVWCVVYGVWLYGVLHLFHNMYYVVHGV